MMGTRGFNLSEVTSMQLVDEHVDISNRLKKKVPVIKHYKGPNKIITRGYGNIFVFLEMF